VYTRARNWSLPWARLIQSTSSHLIFLRSILILSSHICLDLPSGSSFGFSSQNFVCISRLSHSTHTSRPFHLPLFDHRNKICWNVQVTKLHILQSSPASLLGPDILLSTLLSNIHPQTKLRCYFWLFFFSVGRSDRNDWCWLTSIGLVSKCTLISVTDAFHILYMFQISLRIPAVLTQDLHGFPQLYQANSGVGRKPFPV